jgi:hypothetical protein
MAALITPFISALFPGLSATTAAALGSLGASLLLTGLSQLLSPVAKSTDQDARTFPDDLPNLRHVYGLGARAAGTPAPDWLGPPNAGVRYACYLLNSRPSEAVTQVQINDTIFDFDGDLLDFAGPGATVDHPQLGGYVQFWAGLGAQSGPPALFLSEWGDATATDRAKWWPTDRWTGRTVLFARLERGPSSSQSDRWRQFPPQVQAIGAWSRVWDPREAGQSATNPVTWTASANAWLCILDLLRRNPFAQLPLTDIDVDSFISAANEADEAVALKSGGTEPRYRLGGTVEYRPGLWFIDAARPLLAACGGDLMLSGGTVRAVTPRSRAPMLTVTNFLRDSGLSFAARTAERDMPRAVQGVWVQPQAKFSPASTDPINIAGRSWQPGQDKLQPLDLSLVNSGTQAQRLTQIAARRAGLVKRLTFTSGPEFFAGGLLGDLPASVEAGDFVTVDLPGLSHMNGLYQVAELRPGEWMAAGDGVAFAQPVVLRQAVADLDAWDPDTDEQPVFVPELDDYDPSILPPASVTLAPGPARLTITVAPSPDPAALDYVWEWRLDAAADWTTGGVLTQRFEGGVAQPMVAVLPTQADEPHVVRVRAQANGSLSDWLESDPATPLSVVLDAGEY